MIARIWHGWTEPGHNADAYHQLLKTKILPGIHRVKGYRGAHLLRCESGNEVEFITITMWENMDAVREFSGPEGHAVVLPEAQKLLKRYDPASVHYEATWVE